MRKMTLERIDETIESNRKMVNQKIKISASQKAARTRRYRTRSKGERV